MIGDRRYRRRSQIQLDPAVVKGDFAVDPSTGRAQIYRTSAVYLVDESMAGAAYGYASLNGAGIVPYSQLGTGGTGAGTKFLADDGTWKTGGGGGGTFDHAALTLNLEWSTSAHTGTASRFAVFDSGGAAAYLTLPSTGIVSWTGSSWAAATVSAPLSYSGTTLSVSVFTGDTGSGGAAGTVPAPSAGDGAIQKYLSASGGWLPIPTGLVSFYEDPSVSSDISGYKVALTAPSAAVESTLTSAATGTSDNLLASFATAAGIPAATVIPHGTYNFHFHVETGASNQVGRLKLEVYTCSSTGTSETLRTSGYSDSFSAGPSEINIGLTDSNNYTISTTDRLVFKIYASRVSGPSTCNITVYFNGSTRNPSILSTIGAVTPAIVGAEPAITAGTTSQYWRGDKSWQTLDKSAVGLGNVENTALSTWVGSANITTLGTVTTGTWSATTITTAKGGTGLSSYTAGDLVYYSSGTALSKLGIGTSGYLLSSSGSAPQWRQPSDVRSDLGLVIGTNVQAYDAGLTSLTSADASAGLPYVSGANTWATATYTAMLSIVSGAWKVVGLRESGGTDLTMGAIGAGEVLVRSGTTIASAAFSALLSGYSALLAAIQGLGSNGIIVKSGSSAYARTIAAGSGITVTNGDGVSGNPVITASGSSGAGGGSSAVTLYGSARDGDVTFNGGAVTGWSLAGSTYTRTLARDPHYKTLTIATGYSLVAAGTRIRCRTLVMGDNCSITAPGGSASLSTAGTGSAPSAVATSSTGACFYGSAAGAAGRTTNAVGLNGGAIPAGAFRAGGAGGTGSTSGGRVRLTSVSAIGASGSAGTGTDASPSTSWHYYGDPFDVVALTGVFRNGTSIAQIAGGGSGGGGAASFLSGTGSSGGSGAGGGVCVVFAASANFGTGCSISANGGNGGNAGTGSTDSVLAGGHGGGGGLLVCVLGEITGLNVPTFSANGGNGGNASRSGTGYWAEGGNGGDGGNLFVYVGTNSTGITPTYTANGGTKGTDAGSGTGFVGAANGTNSTNVYYNEGT